MPGESKEPDGGSTAPLKKEGATKKNGQGGAAKGFAPRAPKFEGKCPDLKGHIYDATDARQSDQFIKTTREIGEYVGRTYKYGGDIRLAVEKLSSPTIIAPDDHAVDAGPSAKRIWEKMIDEYVRRISYLDENIKTLYSLVWGQCSDVIRQKVESHKDYEDIASSGDGIKLLVLLKGISFHFQSQKYLPHSIHEALKRYYNCSQGRYATTQAYMEHFQNVVDVVTTSGGSIAGHKGVEDTLISKLPGEVTRETITDIQLKKVLEESTERSTAIAFLLGCDRSRYGKLIEDLENDFLQGRDNYPTTVVAVYNLLTNWKQENRAGWRAPTADGVAFANADDGKKAAKPRNVTCHKCGVKGHYATDCPELAAERAAGTTNAQTGTTLLMAGIADGEFDDGDKTSFTFVNHGITLQIGSDGCVPKSWILLDNQSTVDVFYNPDLLTDIREVEESMSIHCNSGVTTTNWVGELSGYGTVWFHPNGIANILSLARVKEQGYRVTYDSIAGNRFVIHKSDGTTRIFNESTRGLYYLDVKDHIEKIEEDDHDNESDGQDIEDDDAEEKAGNEEEGVTLVITVADNRTKYTNRAYSRAALARKIQKMIGRPSTSDFIKIVEGNLLPNCPVTRADIIAAEKIFGPDVGILKGKTVRKGSQHVEATEVTIPSDLMSEYRNVVIGADVMYINKLPFFVTMSRNLKFSTAELMLDQKQATMVEHVKRIQRIYVKRGFRIAIMLMDGQFDVIRGDLADLGITLNTVARGEHVPEIERQIRTIKERVRCVYAMLPFKKIPRRMLVELVYFSVFWLNSFPANDGISATLSPRSIVHGTHVDFTKHAKLEFGAYVQAHEEHDNTMATRTTGAIALRPTGNAQGGYYLFSLSTGKVLNRNNWTELPMPNEVIDRVHVLARRAAADLTFADRDGAIIPDEEDDEDADADPDYAPADDDMEDDDDGSYASDNDDDDAPADYHDVDGIDPDVDIAGVYGDYGDEEDNPNGDNPNEPLIADPVIVDVAEAYMPNEDEDRTDLVDNNEGGTDPADDEDQQPDNANADGAEPAGIDEEPPNDGAEPAEAARPGAERYNLRAQRPRDYAHLHTTLAHTVMTQYSMKKGIAEFGEDGVEAVLSELKQLHDRKVLEPKAAGDLTREEKRAALHYLMFLKKKRCGRIKGRGCADGRKQRIYTTKEDASSPTVAIEALMLSCVIDAKERRDVGIVDIPGAFMQADMDETVHMKMEGKMAELLVRIDPAQYRKYVAHENGKMVLYVELKKALYGTLKAALLFWRLLSKKLTDWGFEANPYDACVMNKTINGKQCTILWHVDDLKISHVDPEVVTEMIDLLEEEFGKEAPLTKTRGKVHEYLGMTIDFSEDGKVKFSMIDYVQKMLDSLPEDMGGESITPASNHLFEVNPEAVRLDEATSELFHHNTAKLLFLCKRARPDTQTAVAFLCTRVQGPDVDDYQKLRRVMRYLRATKLMPLVLEADTTNVIKWWADASYAVHVDMRSHTGGCLTMGEGIIYGTSFKQKLTTKSSTEAELVAASDVMPQILWTRYFLEAQGYGVNDNIVYQDNKSAILLEKHGRASSSKRTRHINIRYFFVKDRIESNEVSVEFCPTEHMIADYFTKPLQGSLFKKFRDRIMNHES